MVMTDKALYKSYDLIYVLGRHERLVYDNAAVRHKPRHRYIRKLALRIISVKYMIVAVQGLQSRAHLDKVLLLRLGYILLQRIIRPSNRYWVTARIFRRP